MMEHPTDSPNLKTSIDEEDLALGNKLNSIKASLLEVEAIEAKYSNKMQNNIEAMTSMKVEMKKKIDEENFEDTVNINVKCIEMKKVNKRLQKKSTIIKRYVESVKKHCIETMKELTEAKSPCQNKTESNGNEMNLQSLQEIDSSVSTSSSATIHRNVLGDISNVQANVNGTGTGIITKRTGLDAKLKNPLVTKKIHVEPNSTLDKAQNRKGFQFTLSEKASNKGEYLIRDKDSHPDVHFYDNLVNRNKDKNTIEEDCENKPTCVHFGNKKPKTYFPSNIKMPELNRFFVIINEKTGWELNDNGNYEGNHFHEELLVQYWVKIVLKNLDEKPVIITAYPFIHRKNEKEETRFWVVRRE